MNGTMLLVLFGLFVIGLIAWFYKWYTIDFLASIFLYLTIFTLNVNSLFNALAIIGIIISILTYVLAKTLEH